jgi:hypothetical protein
MIFAAFSVLRRDVSHPVQSRVCYVKFAKAESVGVAQHLTNTVFIDRAIIVIPELGGALFFNLLSPNS